MFARLVENTSVWAARWGKAATLRARMSEHGATAVEYGLMVGLIAVVIVGAVTIFGQGVDALFVIPAGVFGGM